MKLVQLTQIKTLPSRLAAWLYSLESRLRCFSWQRAGYCGKSAVFFRRTEGKLTGRGGTSERPVEKSLPNVYPLLRRVKEKTNVHGVMQGRRAVKF